MQIHKDGTSELSDLGFAEYFGSAAAALPDLDWDGVSELAIGASRRPAVGMDRYIGAVYVLFLDASGGVKSGGVESSAQSAAQAEAGNAVSRYQGSLGSV